MESDTYEQHLMQLWKQGGKDVALAFLRRALSMEHTLEKVLAALEFEGVKEHLDVICVKDIFQAKPVAKVSAMEVTDDQQQVVRVRRRRRSSDELQQLKTASALVLAKDQHGLTANQITEQLAEQGHEIDTIRVNLMLKQMEADGQVVDLGGKPKLWRYGNQVGRRTAEPMLIKKKQAS